MAQLPWKRVWLIGASTGIGFEVAKQLSQAGVEVAASARNVDHLGDTTNVHPYQLDVTDAAAVANVFEKICEDLGPVDLVIGAAGKYRPVFLQLARYYSGKALRNLLGNMHYTKVKSFGRRGD